MAEQIEKEVVALVGAGGIGIAIARRVAAGKHLVVTSRTQEKADRIAADLQKDGFEATSVACDLGTRADILAVIKFIMIHKQVHDGVSPCAR